MATKLSNAQIIQRKTKIANMFMNEQGRKALAADFTRLFKMVRDYVGLGRKFLRVDPLGQGVPATYDYDPMFGAIALDKDGETPVPVVHASRFTVDTFTISTPVQFTLSEAREMRYHLPDRIRDKGKVEVIREALHLDISILHDGSNHLGLYLGTILLCLFNFFL